MQCQCPFSFSCLWHDVRLFLGHKDQYDTVPVFPELVVVFFAERKWVKGLREMPGSLCIGGQRRGPEHGCYGSPKKKAIGTWHHWGVITNKPKALSAFSKISKETGAGKRWYKKQNKGNNYLSDVFSVILGGAELTTCDHQVRDGLPGNSLQPSGSLASYHLSHQQHSFIAIAFSSLWIYKHLIHLEYNVVSSCAFSLGLYHGRVLGQASLITFYFSLNTRVIGEKSH